MTITKHKCGKIPEKSELWILIEGYIDNVLNKSWPETKNTTRQVSISFAEIESWVRNSFTADIDFRMPEFYEVTGRYDHHGWSVSVESHDNQNFFIFG